MSDFSLATEELAVVAASEELADDAVKKKLGLGFWVSVGWLVALVVAVLAAPLLPMQGEVADGPARVGPGVDHWFGTDALGRDVFGLTIRGARVSLIVGAFAIVFGMVVGGSLGLIAGYFKGRVDQLISFVFFTLLSFPGLVLALLMVSTFDRTLGIISLTLGILAVAPVGRLSRAATLVFSEREFVLAARVIGAKDFRIIRKELLPNVLIPMAALALLGMGVAIVAEGGLAFLGLSVQDQPTWGKVINDGRSIRDLQDNAHVALMPILMMFLTILALNFAGDRVREYFDVRETAF